MGVRAQSRPAIARRQHVLHVAKHVLARLEDLRADAHVPHRLDLDPDLRLQQRVLDEEGRCVHDRRAGDRGETALNIEIPQRDALAVVVAPVEPELTAGAAATRLGRAHHQAVDRDLLRRVVEDALVVDVPHAEVLEDALLHVGDGRVVDRTDPPVGQGGFGGPVDLVANELANRNRVAADDVHLAVVHRVGAGELRDADVAEMLEEILVAVGGVGAVAQEVRGDVVADVVVGAAEPVARSLAARSLAAAAAPAADDEVVHEHVARFRAVFGHHARRRAT